MVDKISFFNNLEYGWKCFYISNCLSRYKDSGWVYNITIVFPLTSSFRCTIDSDVAPRWRTFPCLQMKNISKLFKSSIFNLWNIKQKSSFRKQNSWPDVLYLMHSNAKVYITIHVDINTYRYVFISYYLSFSPKLPLVMMYNHPWIHSCYTIFVHVKSKKQMFAHIPFMEWCVYSDAI